MKKVAIYSLTKLTREDALAKIKRAYTLTKKSSVNYLQSEMQLRGVTNLPELLHSYITGNVYGMVPEDDNLGLIFG